MEGEEGELLRVTVRDAAGREGVAESTVPLQRAGSRPLSREEVIRAVGQLGDTPYTLLEGDISTEGLAPGVFMPAGEIKGTRRRAVESLTAARARAAPSRDEGLLLPTSITSSPLPSLSTIAPDDEGDECDDRDVPVAITPLCRTPQQVAAACAIPWVEEVYLDFLEVHGLREAVGLVKAAGKTCVRATTHYYLHCYCTV